VAEWELALRVTGRSLRTIQWYLQKVDQFLGTAGVGALEDLTALSLKRSIAGERERGLADNTVRASFEVVKGLTL
jgi:hypothetical protein